MGRLSILLSFLLVSLRSFALECPLPGNASSYTCEGVYVAKDMKTLKKYLSSNYGSSEGKAKDLKITFDLSDKSSIKIVTPCSLFISSKKKVDPDKLCLNARDGIEFSKETKIQTHQVDFNSPSFVKLSHGTKVDSTNFRIDATKIIVASDVKFDSDKVILNAKDKLIIRDAKVKVSTFEANAADCVIDPDLKIKGKKKGNCFDNSHPKLKVKYSSFEGEAPFTFQVDTSKSTDDVGITHYVYSWGDGNSDSWTSSFASHIYTTPGKYLVTVRAYDALGLYDERRHSVNVLPSSVVSSLPPYADLKFSQYPSGLDISFSLLAWDQDGEVTSAKISYGDGLTETVTNPLYNHALYHRYETAGSYEVTLTVTDSQGLSSSKKYTVQAGGESVSMVSILEFFHPAPLKVLADFHKSFAPMDYQREGMISWGDGSTTSISWEQFLTHEYAQEGTYTVSLTLINTKGLSSTIEKQIVVNNSAGEKIYPIPSLEVRNNDFFSSVRFYFDRSFDPDGSIAKVHLDYGDGDIADILNPVDSLWIAHAYELGSYVASLTLTDNDGLSSTLKVKVDITEQDGFKVRGECWIQDPTNKLAGCGFEGVSNGANINHVDFDWADGVIDSPTLNPDNYVQINTQHTYIDPGVYLVKIKATNEEGATSSFEKALYVGMNAPPVAQVSCFLYYGAVYCNGYLSYDPDGYIGTYEWKWDDGMVEYGPNPQPHYFSEAGTHLVTLKVTDNLGSSSEASTTIQIIPNKAPVIDSFACSVVEGLKVHCDLSARDEDGSITSVQYGWGPENTSSPDYEYAKKGQYNIAVYVADDQGSSVSANTTLTVGPPNNAPVIDSFACTADENLNAHCDLQAHDPDGDPLTFQYGWGTGDYTSSPDYQYTKKGQYNLVVYVNDDSGVSTMAETSLYVGTPNRAPVIDSFACTSNEFNAHCDLQVHDPDGDPLTVQYHWGIGDYTSSADYTYGSYGDYGVAVYINDDQGGAVQGRFSLHVMPPNIAPIPQAFCYVKNPLTVHCDSSLSYDPDGVIFTRQWDLGDGFKTSDVSFDYKFSSAGIYPIKLTVGDGQGAEASQVVYADFLSSSSPPIAKADCSYTSPYTVRCNCLDSKGMNGDIKKCLWESEGVTKTGVNVDFVYPKEGLKKISLAVFDSGNLGASSYEYVDVFTSNPPLASPVCKVEGIKLICDGSTSTDPDGNEIVYYYWDIKGEDVVEGKIITTTLSRFGDHTVTLSVINRLGVLGKQKVMVFAPTVYLPPSPSFLWEMNLNKEVAFDATNSLKQGRTAARFEWKMGDGNVVTSTTPYLKYTYSSFDDKEVELTVVDQLGESATSTGTVFVHDPRVAVPPVENDKTILGIDSDNDGIRDDVERWIIRVSKDNSEVESALDDVARELQRALQNTSNPELLKVVNSLIEKRRQCLSYLLPEKKLGEIMHKMALYRMFKTKERYKAWELIQHNGDVSTRFIEYTPSPTYTKEEACEQ